MFFKIICGSCQSKIKVPDKLAGKTRRCPKCGNSIQLVPPGTESAEITPGLPGFASRQSGAALSASLPLSSATRTDDLNGGSVSFHRDLGQSNTTDRLTYQRTDMNLHKPRSFSTRARWLSRAGIAGLVLLLGLAIFAEQAEQMAGTDQPANLREAIWSAGFPKDMDWVKQVESYVRFGSKKTADNYKIGDQFDRLEIKRNTEQHRTELIKKIFRIDGLKFVVAPGTDLETNGLFADLFLPFMVRGEKLFYDDNRSFSGCLSTVHPSEAEPPWAYLTKEGVLKRCTEQEAALVQKNQGVLYLGQGPSTDLVLNFVDNLDVLKNLARRSKEFSVEIEVSELRWELPLIWGYFRQDAWKDAHYDCEKLCSDAVKDPTNPQPVYFVTAWGKEEIEKAKISEIVRAKLISLKILDQDGKVIGGYRVGKNESNAPRVSVHEQKSVIGEGAPSLLIAPFDEQTAKGKLQEWSKYIKRDVEVTNSIGMKLTLIPAGEFTMGSPEEEFNWWNQHSDEEKQHRVRITKPFFMGVYTVTQEEYEKLMENNPSYFSSNGIGKDQVIGMDTSRFPVEQVSWDDAQVFCRKLSQKEGKTYRLPTEAEWEYACRAGTTTPFNFGSDLNGDQANCDGRHPYGTLKNGPDLKRTTQVGSFRPNAFGLYDMHGNVLQWCSDRYGLDYYSTSSTDDPQGPDSGTYRVRRGGCWGIDAVVCRAANRNNEKPTYRFNSLGFRVVCEQ